MSYADVNGLSLHYEEQGTGEPLVLLHGGIGTGEMFAPILPELTVGRRVVTVDLQGHGGTADVDRPLRAELMADDIAALLDHLGLEQADVMGYSLGGLVALRTAIQHPQRIRRLVLVAVGFRRDGSHPEVVQAMDQMSAAAAEPMRQSPLYEQYARLAPRVEDWPVLIGKIADALKVDYDWTRTSAGSPRKRCSSTPTRTRSARRTSSSSSRCSAAGCATPAGTARRGPTTSSRSCRAGPTTTSSWRPGSVRRWRSSSTPRVRLGSSCRTTKTSPIACASCSPTRTTSPRRRCSAGSRSC